MRAIPIVLVFAVACAETQPQSPSVSPANAFLSRALNLERARDLAGAEKEFRGAAALPEPAGYIGAISLSDFLVRHGRTEELEAIFQRGFDRTKDRRYLASGAAILARIGNTATARKMLAPLAEAMKAEQLSPEVTGAIASAWRTLGENELALTAARLRQQAYRLGNVPKAGNFPFGDARVIAGLFIAELLEDMGRPLEAENELELLYDEFPSDEMLLNHYAYYLAAHNKKLETALAMARKAATIPAIVPIFEQETEGLILIKMGRTEEAIDYLVRMWRAAPGSSVLKVRLPSVRLHLAQALAKRRESSPAMRSLLDALNGESNDANRLEIERLLRAVGE